MAIVRTQEGFISDPCKPMIREIESLELEKKELQAQLRTASPRHKPFINQQIKRVNNQIRAQKRELQDCRRDNPAPPPSPPPFEASLTGRAVFRTTHERARGPIEANVVGRCCSARSAGA